jgi:hypothetical protein
MLVLVVFILRPIRHWHSKPMGVSQQPLSDQGFDFLIERMDFYEPLVLK